MNKPKILIGIITTILISLGYVFRVNHWSGGIFFLLIGFIILLALYLPIIFIDRIKETDNQFKKASLFTGLGASFILFLGIMFRIFYWPGGAMVHMIGVLTFSIIAFPMFAISCLRDNKSEIKDAIFISIVIIGIVSVTQLDKKDKGYLNCHLEIGSKLEKLHSDIKLKNTSILSIQESTRGNDTLLIIASDIYEQIESLKDVLILTCEGSQSQALDERSLITRYDCYPAPGLVEENSPHISNLLLDLKSFESIYNNLIDRNNMPESFKYEPLYNTEGHDIFSSLESSLSSNPISINLMTLSMIQIDILNAINLYLLKV